MLINASYLEHENGITQDTSDPDEVLSINDCIAMACCIIDDYVGFDSDTVIAQDSQYSEKAKGLFRKTCARIATLLQTERGGNIGVNTQSEPGVNRSFLNIVDYTPYLRQLSAYRQNTDM